MSRDIDIIDGIQDNDRRVINYLKKIGYGYAEFAKSVELSGMVSQKQRECMERMVKKITNGRSHYNSYEIISSNKQSNNKRQESPNKSRWYCSGDDGESPGWYGYTEYNGGTVSAKWHDDGRTTYYWGGPCAPTTYDEYGEECC